MSEDEPILSLNLFQKRETNKTFDQKFFCHFKALQLVGQLDQSDFQGLEFSDSNLIAFSSPTPKLKDAPSVTPYSSLRPAKKPKIETIQKDEASIYPIFVFHPNCADQYAVLNTPHTSVIKFIKISPANLGCFLLACDGSQKISLWKMQKSIDSWNLIRTFDQEFVVHIQWLSSKPRLDYSKVQTQQSTGNESFEEKYPLRNVDISGVPFGMLAFLVVRASGSVIVYYCKNSSGSNDPWNNLKISLKFPEHLFILRTEVTISEEGQIFLFVAPSTGNFIYVYELILDLQSPRISGTAITSNRIFVSPLDGSLLASSYQTFVIRHLRADSNNVLYTIISSSSSKCKLSKWELKKQPLIGDETIFEQKWVETASNVLEYNSPNLGVENFITSFSLSSNGKFISLTYISGLIEIRNSGDFHVLKSIDAEYTNSESIPLISCFSPNDCCLCVFDPIPRVQIFSLDSIVFTEQDLNSLARHFVDLTHLSLLKYQDWWDVLVNYSRLEAKSTKPNGILAWIYAHLAQDAKNYAYRALEAKIFSNLSKEDKINQENRIRIQIKAQFERILNLFLFCTNNQHVNYMDSQIRLSLFWTIHIFRELFHHSVVTQVKEVMEKKKQLKAVLELDQTNLFTRISKIQPFIDWVSKFSLFFVKNILHFMVHSQPTVLESTPVLFDLPADVSASVYCPIYWINQTNPFPCVSLLLDSDLLNVIQEVVVFNTLFLKNTNRQISLDIYTTILALHPCITAVFKDAGQTAAAFPKILSQLANVLKDKVNAKITSKPHVTEMKELEVTLDLNPPKLGYFSKEPKPITGMNFESQIDVANRNLLDPRTLFRCIRCNRLTSSLTERACPLCGGQWKCEIRPQQIISK